MKAKGVPMVITAAVAWGLSGIGAQLFFSHFGGEPGWLVSVRMLSAGILMIVLACLRQGATGIFAVWSHKKDRRSLLLFGLVGMLGVQYTFFEAIDSGNAATATLLQYLGPVFIIAYISLRVRKMPGGRELAAFALALAGIFLMTTGGSFDSLTMSPEAFVWGILSALAAAVYTLYPGKLLAAWGSVPVVGWSMLIGGTGLALLHPPWAFDWSQGSLYLFGLLAFIVVIGTIIPFFLFLESLRYVTPAKASILSSAEPLTSVLVGTVFLHIPMDAVQLLGSLCIILTVIVLTVPSRHKAEDAGERTVSG
ncbi:MULTISPECIES: EamA family transporter [Paenibacillus]|uniref:EamA family transporter n=1 Tax=Paenibacillus TaxID=44249 RepID=UPI0022B90707|nr:EamA family transporter [Paenibacillus caseinilyticus]MCZ8523992.1 EamA family transporter [Paenibacillus caseinilyticus]